MRISEEKVWLKYYPENSIHMELPKCTIYSYLKNASKDRLHNTAIHYYGTNITYKKLFERINECADAFAALGVKQGDVVSFLSVSVPE